MSSPGTTSPSDTRDSSEWGGDSIARAGRGVGCQLSALPGGAGGLPGCTRPAGGGDGAQGEHSPWRPKQLPWMGVASCSGGPGPGGGSPLPSGPTWGGGSDTVTPWAWPRQLPNLNASLGNLCKLAALRTDDATGFLLTVIKSLANGLGRKNSHDEDLC